jgi:molecular chaperone GrpE (heat shock protein)
MNEEFAPARQFSIVHSDDPSPDPVRILPDSPSLIPHHDSHSRELSTEPAEVFESPTPVSRAQFQEGMNTLRMGLKMQARSLKEIQQMFGEGLQRLEQRLLARQTAVPEVNLSEEQRKLADALAEMEESLQRAVDSLNQSAGQDAAAVARARLARFDQLVANSGTFAQWAAAKLFANLREEFAESIAETRHAHKLTSSTAQGLELLLERARRLLKQNHVVRVEVLHDPFNPETMRAVDVIEAGHVRAGHVAEQLRPLYLWRNQVLRFADVRLAR